MEPQRRPDLRVGDAEREQTLERLRDAHAEGRLDADEFYERMESVYAARTYADLDALVLDLPAAGVTRWVPQPRAVGPQPGATTPAPSTSDTPSSPIQWLRAMPPELRASWAAWATAVLINVVIWAAVAYPFTGDVTYFWPIWVAGPWGLLNILSTVRWSASRGDGGQPELGRGS